MDEKRLVSLAGRLLARGGTLESTEGSGPIDRDQLVATLENRILSHAGMSSELPKDVTAKVAALQALAHSESALQKVANDGSPTNLTDLEVSALEAIIEVTGRPAQRYSNGRVQSIKGALGDNVHWQVIIATARSDINTASASVGKIAITNNFGLAEGLGTGWRTHDNLIVTNRHVALDLVSNPTDPVSAWKLDAGKKSFIDFAATDNSAGAKSFTISDLVFVAADIDLAILSITSAAATLPKSLTVNWAPESLDGREIYVVGHPFRRRASELVVSVFGVADGTKRWSPGYVKRIASEEPLLEHDCSTLGGNSGSCVFTTDTHEVVGVHFGGMNVNEETAKGSANLAIPLSRLGDHHAAKIIRDGTL